MTILEYLKTYPVGARIAASHIAKELGLPPEAVEDEAFGSNEIVTETTPAGTMLHFKALPPRKLTREERKISKSSQ